jgi:hypothetical protein
MSFRSSPDAALQDVKLGVRSLRKHPFVTGIAIVTLTLGIGVSTGIFALVNAFWLRPPVEKDPGSFVRLFVYNGQRSFNFGQPGSISLEDYREYETAHSLAELAAWHQVRPVFGAMNPKPLRGVLVSCNFFSVYGLTKPELGRLLLPEECSGTGPNSVVVISDEFWRTQFNADAKILGRTILLNRRPFVIVGVTPPHFPGRMSFRISAWIPLMYPMAGQLEQDIVVPLGMQGSRYTAASASAFFGKIERRVLSLPGVASICFTDTPPFDGSLIEEFRFRDQTPGFGRTALVSTVSVDCLDALGIRAINGRLFDQGDLLASPAAPPAVVSQAFARSFWPQEDPLGKTVLDPTGTPFTVLGVVNDTKSENFGVADGPRIYQLEVHPRAGDALILRVNGDPSGITGSVKEIVRSLDPDMIAIPRTVRSEIDDAARRMHGLITMMVVLASGVVFLAVMGIYGVVWFAVSRRTKEMGIRIALGATKLHLVLQVIQSNIRPVIFGQLAGLLLAIGGSVALRNASTDIGRLTDASSPALYVVTFLLLQIASVFAMLGPAISATRKDPVNALRQE